MCRQTDVGYYLMLLENFTINTAVKVTPPSVVKEITGTSSGDVLRSQDQTLKASGAAVTFRNTNTLSAGRTV